MFRNRENPGRAIAVPWVARKTLALFAPLIRRVAAHEFAVVQLREDACLGPNRPDCPLQSQTFKRFTHQFLLAVARYYKIGRRSRNGTFYVPR